MPNLPRIRRTRSGARAAPAGALAERRPLELAAGGLAWVHLDRPDTDTANALADRFGWHELDVEDVLSKRQRPKIDEYAEYLFFVLHFPVYDKAIQRLNAAKLDSVEDDMFERRAEDVVRDLSNVKQEIISYRKIIKPERTTLRLLERRVERFLPEELDLYFDDIVDGAERIWDLLDNYKEVVEGLESTNESVISHRQNDVLR